MQRTLTAMYDTRGAAESARDELVGLGVPSANIVIRGTESTATGTTTTEDKGFWESLADLFVPDEDRYTYAEGMRRGGFLLTAHVPDGMEDQAIDILERSGAVDVDERAESWRQSGWTGYESARSSGTTTAAFSEGAGLSETGTASGYATDRTSTSTETVTGTGYGTTAGATASGTGYVGARSTDLEGEEKLQVTEEQLRVGKREVGRGNVRVRSYVTERPVEEQVNLRQERVHIERRPVDREVAPGEATFQERTIEAVERGEEAVVDKRARVVEEIALRKDVKTETETVRDTVRRQDVEVEDERTGRLAVEDDRTIGGVSGSRTSTDRTTK